MLKQNFKIQEWKRKRAKIIKTAVRDSDKTVLEPGSSLLQFTGQNATDLYRIICQIRDCDWIQILIISSVASFASVSERVPQETQLKGESV